MTLLILLLTAPFVANSQKGKNKSEISESKLREAEYYFTEGEKYFILEDYAKALVLFQKSLDINPQNGTVYYKMAQVYAHGNDLEKALENSKMAMSLDDTNKYFYILTADIYTQMSNFPKAAEVYEELIGKVKKTEIYLFELAALYLYQQRYDDAITTYNKIESAYGLSEEIAFQKQKIYLQLNKLDLAIKEGDKLISAFPDEENFVLKQSEILIAYEKYDEASKYLNDYLKRNPERSQSRLILAELKRKKGDLKGALADLTIAFKNPELYAQNKIQLLAEYRTELPANQLENFAFVLAKILVTVHSDVADAHTIYADLLQQAGKTDSAKMQYNESLKLDQSNFAVWQNVLQLHFELNEIDSVIDKSNRALELFPNQGAFYYFNGAANLQEKKYKEAIFALEQGKKLASSNLSLLSAYNSMLGDAYNSTQDYKKSDAAFDAALDFDPNNYGLLNNYSYYLALRKENLEKAEKMAFKVIQNNPENITFLDTYAWVLYSREKYKEAKKIMEKAIAIGGVEAIHYEHYGDILYKLGNIDGAVTQWQIAKGMDPNAELIDKKIADRKLYE